MWLQFLHKIRLIAYAVYAALFAFGLIVICFSQSPEQGWLFISLSLVGVVAQLGIRYEARKDANDARDTIG